MKNYKVMVPWINKIVSYPASGFALYTRIEAIEILQRLYQRLPWNDGDKRECWAENSSERFTLHFPLNLVVPNN